MFTESINGIELHLETSAGLFSPGKIDAGTRAMLSVVDFQSQDLVLDLGCGCGVVGIYTAKRIGPDRVTLCDISQEAVAISQQNAQANGVSSVQVFQSDGFTNIVCREFTWILSNPPYHADFAVAKRFIEGAFQHLSVGGKMVMVTKRLTWYKNKLTSVFGGVRIEPIEGYFVFTAEKRSSSRPVKKKEPPHLSKKLTRASKYEKAVEKGRKR